MIDTAFTIDKNKTLDFVGYFDGMASVLEEMPYLIENDEQWSFRKICSARFLLQN
jgi:hypothetical protein